MSYNNKKLMTTLEKIELAIKRGMTYDKNTGLITGPSGNIIISKTKKGYIQAPIWNNKVERFLGHIFAWYFTYKEMPSLQIDHINGIRHDNRIDNLRLVTSQENSFNRNCKGYSQRENGKWRAILTLNRKRVFDKTYDTEEEAIKGREEAKQKYHIINEHI